MPKVIANHYEWLEKHLPAIIASLNLGDIMGCIVAEGDKCYSYKDEWKAAGIPFPHGVAMYILSKVNPYYKEVRETEHGWVPVATWIAENYPRFKAHFPTEDLKQWA